MIAVPRGKWGWLVLGLVLLVPVLGFWRWRGGIGDSRRESPMLKPSTPAFGKASGLAQNPGVSLAQPSAPTPALPAGVSVRAGAAPIPSARPVQMPAPLQVSVPQNVSNNRPLPSPMPSPAHGKGGQGAAAAPANASAARPAVDEQAYSPKTDRDPTLSPADLEKLKAMKESGALTPGMALRHQDRVEDHIQLNGIITSASGNNAIINGARVRERGMVLGAKIRRITATCVEFEHKKRTFKKCIKG